MGVSIIDIAALEGVSKSTVSAVINNHPNVRPATRERVMEAIRQLDYHPNFAARELITASPMNIGIIMPSYSRNQEKDSSTKYFNGIDEGSNLELVSQLVEQISKTNYGVLVEHTVVSNDEPELPVFALSKRVAGVFQISPLLNISFVHRLRQYVPTVVEIGTPNPECDSVYSDFVETGCISVDYLVRARHRKIAFINCDPASRTVKDRLEGYTAGLKKNGLTYHENWVRYSSFTGIGGYNAFSDIWKTSVEKPTAVICASSTIASGALHFMCNNGIAVPDDVSIVCNGDSLLSEFAMPQLTAICRDKEEIAKCAFTLLMERLSDQTLPVRAVKIADHIIERNSVKRMI